MAANNYDQVEEITEGETPAVENIAKTEAPADVDKILSQAIQQLQTSRDYKRARFDQIKENENLYHGVIEKSIRNPFNECFPFMAGFVDHLKSKIDDDSTLKYSNLPEAKYKSAQKVNAFFERVAKSPAPCDSWNVKHRYAKYNAIFSGVAIYKYYSVKPYKSYLEVISHYDFHCEPRGGGMLENHLFCGQDNIFKNIEDLKDAKYNQDQAKMLEWLKGNEHKAQTDSSAQRDNRAEALKQQPESYNYVGQATVKLAEFYTTYKGVRYYILFHEDSRTWLRCCLLKDMFSKNLYPYVAWHTNEDDSIFWSKAPCDDARPIAKIINTFINQELYNRQKRNYGQRAFDPTMFPNTAALADWRPDGMIPFDSKNGTRDIRTGFYELKVGDLNGTLDLVGWLESFTGKQMGNTAGSQGDAGKNKQATVFVGEIRQVEQLIGVKNKSFTDAMSRLGLLFLQGLKQNLEEKTEVKVMGAKGIENQILTKAELENDDDLSVIAVGGTSELELKKVEDARKMAAVTNPNLKSVNPIWKERQMLILQGFTEADVKEAFSSESLAEKELMSEAAIAEQEIVEGKNPALNRGATAEFMQHIVDFATNTNKGEIDPLPLDIYKKLIAYSEAHMDIVIENMNKDIKKKLADRAKLRLSTTLPQENGNGTITPNESTTGRTNEQINGATPQIPT